MMMAGGLDESSVSDLRLRVLFTQSNCKTLWKICKWIKKSLGTLALNGTLMAGPLVLNNADCHKKQ